MSRTKSYALFILAIASALGVAWVALQRRGETGGLRFWQQVLIRRHGAEKAQQLAAAVRQRRAVLVAETPMPENQALRWHLKKNILPGLTLDRVLLQEYTLGRGDALCDFCYCRAK